jgi:hypothetical protein
MKNLNLLTLCLTFVISCGTTESEHKLETTQENKDTFNNNVESYRSLFVDGFKDEDIEKQMSLFADSLKWSPPSYNGNVTLGKNDLKEAILGYHENFDNITFLEGDGSIFGDNAAYWGGSMYSDGPNGIADGPNGLRIYGRWNSTHSESGAEVNNKWYGLVVFNEDGKISTFSDWMDVSGMAIQIETHLNNKKIN